MARTLDKNRLKNIRVTGQGLSTNVVEAAASASFSLAYDQVTELSLTINDDFKLSTFRSGVLSAGSTVTYGEWTMTIGPVDVKPGPIGPQLSVVAASRAVTRLRKQTGAKNWGERDVSGWARDIIKSSGAKARVQPGLGRQSIQRTAKKGEQKQSSWDVLASVAGKAGAWLFENGDTIVLARPNWITTDGIQRQWNVHWNEWDNLDPGLQGMPTYSNHPDSDPAETLQLRLVSADADQAAPGDLVELRGRHPGEMRGRWIITGVDYPFTVAGAVTVDCVRPRNPEKETE